MRKKPTRWAGMGIGAVGFALTGLFLNMALQSRADLPIFLLVSGFAAFSLYATVSVIEDHARETYGPPVDIGRLNPYQAGTAEYERWRDELIAGLTRKHEQELAHDTSRPRTPPSSPPTLP